MGLLSILLFIVSGTSDITAAIFLMRSQRLESVAQEEYRDSISTEEIPISLEVSPLAHPANWYPDSENIHIQRYWDGTQWLAVSRWDGTQWISTPL